MQAPSKRAGRPNKEIPIDELPNQVRALRLASGYTLEQLAEIVGVYAQTLSEYELHGRGGRSFVYKLADHFQKDPRDLEKPGKNFQRNYVK